jgi:hypothetical protein
MMDEAMKSKLTDLFGSLAVKAAGLLEPAYGEALARMTIAELLALDGLLKSKQVQEARNAIRAKMTAQELADEKTKLAWLTYDSAVAEGKAWGFGEALVSAGLRLLMLSLLGMVGL